MRLLYPDVTITPMNKEIIYRFLKERNIPFEITEHKAVYTMDELDDAKLPYPEWDGKTSFLFTEVL